MNEQNNVSEGTLKISEDVVIKAAKLATLDVKGVAGLKNQKIAGIFEKKNAIRIKRLSDVIEISVKVIVKGNAKASAVAFEVQNTVKENVQNMTGIAVSKVNVLIDGIEFE